MLGKFAADEAALMEILTKPKNALVKQYGRLFEMEGVTEVDARRAMELAAAKLPIKTKFAMRFGQEKAS